MCVSWSTLSCPPALARALATQGHHAEHVTDIAPADATDRELWNYAVEHGAVLVTKDEDFAEMVLIGRPAPAVVWVRIGNTRKTALLEFFDQALVERVVALIDAGNGLIELR